MSDTMLSRSGQTDSDGKKPCRIDVNVSEELEEGIIALATIAGIPKSEWARRLFAKTVFGELHMLRRMAHPKTVSPGDESPMNSR